MANKDVAEVLLKQLKNPFDPKFVKWRVGATNEKKANGQVIQKADKGIALGYIDSREVMKRLDDVCGVDGWQVRHTAVTNGFICELGIRIGNEWVWKSNAADNTQVASIKGGSSDSLKRAAAVWGVGRYLYYLPNKWVPVNDRKQLIEKPTLPDWALPNKVERWEDVAELQAELESGADSGESDSDVVNVADVLLKIEMAKDSDELTDIVTSLPPEIQKAITKEATERFKAFNNG